MSVEESHASEVLGDRYRIKVAEDGKVVGLWRRT